MESTDGNFGTREKVAILVSTVTCTFPIPIFGIFLFPSSHGIPIGIILSLPLLLCTNLACG